MKNKNTYNITIFKQVIEVMEKNHTLWEHVPKLRQAYDKFLENNKKIEDAVYVSLEDITSLEMKKKETAELLRQNCKPFLQVIGIWAKDSEKKRIAGKLSSFKKLIKSSNPAVILKISEYTQKLSAEALTKGAKNREKSAENEVAALSEFGITKEMLNELNETSTALEQIVLVLRKKKTEIAKAKKIVEKLTSQNKKLLKSRISKFMVLFINSKPVFYENFETSLKIIQLKNKGEKKNLITKKTNVEVIKKLQTIKKASE